MRRETRRGFSLIELLVVVGILSVLATLGLYAVLRVRGSEEEKSAERTVGKIAGIMHPQFKAEVDNAREPGANSGFMRTALDFDLRATVLRAKCGMRQNFPQTFEEALTSHGGLTVVEAYKKVLTGYSTTAPTGTQAIINDAREQAAACLFLAISTGRRGHMTNLEDAAGTGGMKDITVRGKQVRVFIDPWGTPISFFRWSKTDIVGSKEAERRLELDAKVKADARSGSIDPLDPEDLLWGDTRWRSAAAFTKAQTIAGHDFVDNGHNYAPYIISAGPDKEFDTDDDILSFRGPR